MAVLHETCELVLPRHSECSAARVCGSPFRQRCALAGLVPPFALQGDLWFAGSQRLSNNHGEGLSVCNDARLTNIIGEAANVQEVLQMSSVKRKRVRAGKVRAEVTRGITCKHL